MNFTRLFDILNFQQEKYPNREALNSYSGGKWKHHSTDEIIQRVNAISHWLLEDGFVKGDQLAIMPHMGRPEWMMIDFACQQIGVIVVPLHPTSPLENTIYILNETKVKACIVADEALYFKLQPILQRDFAAISLHHILSEKEGYFPALKEKTKNTSRLASIKKSISEDEIATIIYTSGTNGHPKGVVLTHKNLVSNVKSGLAILPIGGNRKALSFLPFSHIFERTTCYTYMAAGISVFFAQDREHIAQDFKSVQPCLFTSVPRILEKMYDLIKEAAYNQNYLLKNLILWSMAVGKQYPGRRRISLIYGLKFLIARILVLNHWKKNLGGHVKYIIVGAAALQPKIARLFASTGIKIREGYGMTEASPFITTNRFEPGLNRVGTVGIPVPGVDVQIVNPDEDGNGEIWVKGPNIMQSYYKNQEKTQSVFTSDGWLKTGDVGHFIDKRFLKITGRKKDIFKTSAGKYIAPQQLQHHFTASSFIQQCLIIGFQRPYITTLIFPNYVLLEKWCKEKNIHWTSPQFMAHNIKIIEKIQTEVDHLNQKLPNHQRIKKFYLCHEEWTIENGFHSASYKPIRRNLMDAFSKEIAQMY